MHRRCIAFAAILCCILNISDALSSADFEKRPDEYYPLTEGDKIQLPCKVKNDHHISYKWLFNDSPIKSDDNHRIWRARLHELALNYLKPEHSGKYTCVAYNTGDKRSEASVSTVVKIYEKLKIIRRPENTHISILEGSPLILPCEANHPNQDLISYQWFFNGVLLEYDTNIMWIPSYHDLLFHSLQMNESGIYSCKVDSTLGSVSMDIHITVLENLLAHKCPPSVVVPSHHSSRSITWTPPFAQDTTGILKHIKVHPPNAIPPFEAPLGETLIKYTLPLDDGQETTCVFQITVFEGIKITKRPERKEYNVIEGGSLFLPCQAYSKDNDHISYRWLFNDSTLNYDEHRLWQADSHELHLKNTKQEHSGKYTCVAYTTGLRSSKAVESTVVKIPEKLEIVKRPEKSHISIKKGYSLRLPCQANYKDEVSYEWLLSGSLIKYDNHREWSTEHHELVIQSVQLGDSGIYTCKVDTEWDTASMDIYVTVLDKFLKRPDKKHITITEGSSLRLPCQINHNDHNILYSWLFNGSPLKYDEHRKWHKNNHELVLKSARTKHSGTYTCQVTMYTPRHGVASVHVNVTIRARYFFTAWSEWSKCLPSHSGSARGHRSRSRTCVTSARIEAPGKCSGKTKQSETCDIEVSTLPPPTDTPSPYTREKIVTFPLKRPAEAKGEAIITERKDAKFSRGKSKFLDTFYGKLALGSSLGIMFVILGCAGFLLVGRRIEKKEKRRRKDYRPIRTSENPTFNQRQSRDECVDEFEDEMDRKAFEKRRVIKELTPKDRKRSELDDDLTVARAIILEEGVNKEHELEVAEKRKKVVKTTSSTACKKSLLESISSSRAIIMDKSPAEDDNVCQTSVSFSPLKEHKSKISSAGSSRDSSFHSLDGTKNTQSENTEDSFSMMMVQPVQPMSFEARQATIKHTHEFSQNQ